MINEVICGLTDDDESAVKAYAWSDPKRGVIALKTASKSRLEAVREAIRRWGNGNEKFEYETYLNDAIVERYSVTVLLKRNFRTIPSDKVADQLFKRNKQLKGSITALKCKIYADTDVNSNGTSRRDWRLIHYEADDTFLKSLEAFPEDHQFTLGHSSTTIKGGSRPESKRRTQRERQRSARSGISKESVSKLLERASNDVIANAERKERDQLDPDNKKRKVRE